MALTRYDGTAFQALKRFRYDGSAWPDTQLKSYRYSGAAWQQYAGEPGGEPVASGYVTTFNPLAVQSLAVTMPASVSAGDTLVVALATRATGSTGIFTAAGWTLVGSRTSTLGMSVLTKTADGTEGGTTVTFTNTATANRINAIAFKVTGVGGFGAASSNSAGGITSLTVPTLTTTGPSRLLLGVFAQTASATDTLTVPAEMTQKATINSTGGVALMLTVATEDRATAGATGTRTVTISPTSGGIGGILIPIQPGWA